MIQRQEAVLFSLGGFQHVIDFLRGAGGQAQNAALSPVENLPEEIRFSVSDGLARLCGKRMFVQQHAERRLALVLILIDEIHHIRVARVAVGFVHDSPVERRFLDDLEIF